MAFVLSRYGGATVANQTESMEVAGARFRAVRAASTPMVVASSSNDATDRVPLRPPPPATEATVDRSSRR